MWRRLKEHVREYWIIYLTLAGVYLAGIVFGSVGVGALGSSDKLQLIKFLDTLLAGQPATLDSQFLGLLGRDSFILMAAIWLLGLTVIGTPLIYLIVFTRGFILGFTVSFIVQAKGMVGLGLVLTGILAPSLLSVPLLFLGAGLATIFSLMLMRGKAKGESLRREFVYYTLSAALVGLAAVAVGVTQGYFSILGMQLFRL